MKPTVEKFRKWRECARADFDVWEKHNLRVARCRVCGCVLQVSEGIAYMELMSDFYRGNIRYICQSCDVATKPRPPDRVVGVRVKMI